MDARSRWMLGMVGAMLIAGLGVGAQSARSDASARTAGSPVRMVLRAEPAGEAATLMFFNRQIVVLRARVEGRDPGERARGAEQTLDDIVEQGRTGPVESHPFDSGTVLTVGTRGIVVLTAPDIDELSGETLESVTERTVERLTTAIGEAEEARAPGRLLRSALLALAAMALAVLLLWGFARAHRVIANRLIAIAEQRMMEKGIAGLEALRASRLLDVQRYLVAAVTTAADLFVLYAATTFVLRRFPYTRPWGESMRGFFLTTMQTLALGVAHSLPGLFTALLIFVLVRFAVRLVTVWFNAIERGQIRARLIYPETAQPTRRLVSTLLWLFAIVIAYPYLPGSQTEAFKGVSVFLGLMITFGSSGIVNQVMSGFMLTYSRALRLGDYVRIGDVEGVVTHLGVLSTKIKTLWGEEVTIPNAVVVTQTTTDFSRFSDSEGVFTPTSVTIGYDVPWRQVQALLLLAAERTPGLRREPRPRVIQAGLEDFYVKYTLLVCLERQQTKPFTLDVLHANIQDLFNEYGVQIMSPNYVVDPASPKVVPKQTWFAAPARCEGSGDGSDARPNDRSPLLEASRP